METNWCILEIDPKEMWAMLAIKLPEGEEAAPITPEYIEAFIRAQGINAGINSSVIEALSSSLTYGAFFEIARGKEPVRGNDGYFEFLVPVEDERSKPVTNEDGSVDYYNSLKIAQVKEGEQFAKYIHATAGEYGHTIFSKLIPPIPGKELPVLKGHGFTKDENKENYFSMYDGHIVKKDNSVDIEKIYVIPGELNVDIGNINFDGDVEVRGDVRSGISINCGGSLFIYGHVGACNIKARKNITIKEGIQGRNRCTINAGEDVICKFVERCSIISGGTVYADSILDSEVFANGEVKVISKTGAIIGGSIIGKLGITAKEIGNESETPTYIQSGPVKEDIYESIELTEKFSKLIEDLNSIENKLAKYDLNKDVALRSANWEEIKKRHQKLLRLKVVVSAERTKTAERLSVVNKHINEARKRAVIHVTGTAFPGIKICIENNYLTTSEKTKDSYFKLENGTIVVK